MRKFIVALMLAAAGTASAAEWQLFNKTEKASFFIDRGSEIRTERARTVWLKTVHDQPQKLSGKRSEKYVQMLELVDMSCKERAYSSRKRVFTAKDGTVISTSNQARPYESVVPDTPDEAKFKAICGERYNKLDELEDAGIRYTPPEKPKSNWNPFD